MSDQADAPMQGKPSLRAWLRKWGPSKGQVTGAMIALLVVSNVGAWAALVTRKPPKIVTVGITELTQGFIAREALGQITPDQARIRMETYLAVSQDTLKRVATEDGVIVLARECVLAGEQADWTAVVDAAVKSAMAPVAGPKPAGLALPGLAATPEAGLARR
ncbi:TrbI F-type domain-containing protein [Caulobacter sp. 17J65-9]|uniref:TrbI F-type domain-containing protein n=1 Tax=Caulobacter sp. 17J65-9 TaxID=2709382 RepID=UPI0013C8A7A1|nr:TrbI F-type domain-containing protein [Caulobacter sp. 17J65-9]NEX91212.1 type-F conjugative transfer system protein TrbI [Caulobacter sp. 17J65-9]